MSNGKEIVKIHTDLDGKVYRLTYNVHGELIAVKHLY
jgi:YD repeat-containing protein